MPTRAVPLPHPQSSPAIGLTTAACITPATIPVAIQAARRFKRGRLAATRRTACFSSVLVDPSGSTAEILDSSADAKTPLRRRDSRGSCLSRNVIRTCLPGAMFWTLDHSDRFRRSFPRQWGGMVSVVPIGTRTSRERIIMVRIVAPVGENPIRTLGFVLRPPAPPSRSRLAQAQIIHCATGQGRRPVTDVSRTCKEFWRAARPAGRPCVPL